MAGKELQIPELAEKEVKNLNTILWEMPRDMRYFSLALRSLYADQAVGGDSGCVKNFRKLRDDTRNDAMVYLQGILPLSTKFVASISDYFDYYDALEFDEWRGMLPEIVKETTAYKELAEALVKMHEGILVPLKKRQDEANIILQEFKDLQQEYEKKKTELEGKAYTKRPWALALLFIPFVNVIAAPLLVGLANLQTAEAIAKGKEYKIQGTVALTVSESLIPALEGFINGLHKAAAFFSIMEMELTKLETKAHRSQEDPKKAHYKMMNKAAREMKLSCQAFYAVLPEVRTDFEAIPTEGTDQNYVDRWLEEQKKVIKEKLSLKKFAIDLLRAIAGPADSSTVDQEDLETDRSNDA